MKIHRFVETLFAAAFTFALLLVNPSTATSAPNGAQQGGYSAVLVSPTAGQVLYPGQKVRVEWKSNLPHIDLGACEAEVWLSLDGGATFTMWISPWIDPKAQYFYWTVPNTPTNAAVLDVRFGCEPGYPESYAPQPASAFVISPVAPL
jgi:hypothetical protein